MARQSVPRRRAAASMKASNVNGVGSFWAQEILARSTPCKAWSMCAVVLITVPQVPSSSMCDSSMS